MDNTKALNPKALEAAIRAYDETILNGELGDAKHVVRAYLTALAAQGDSTKALNPKALEAAMFAAANYRNSGCSHYSLASKVVSAYAAALAQGEAAQPAAEGWIDWPGLKPPVDDDTIIEFLADDGVIERRLARYMRWELPFEYRLPASPNAASREEGAGE